jgi:hypothetical protein
MVAGDVGSEEESLTLRVSVYISIILWAHPGDRMVIS